MESSDSPSRVPTPRSFTSQTVSAEDLLKSQTVGLVHLSDFRKRRAEVLEQKEKEAQDRSYGRFTPGSVTPMAGDGSDGALTPQSGIAGQPPKKKKKKASKGLLSFGNEEDDEDTDRPTISAARSSRDSATLSNASPDRNERVKQSHRLPPNPASAIPAPKVITKAALHAEALARDNLRKEFLALQETVKATEILIPFVFYDGTNIPGGTVRIKKGDHIWLFLDRCRKVGAQLGVAGGGSGGRRSKSKSDSRKEWARVGVDDLMCIRGEVIIPHHYEFYYFIANRVPSPTKSGTLLFDYSNTAPLEKTAGSTLKLSTDNDGLEGKDVEPTLTKVIDRRWYERNKHIFPASLWKEYEPGKEFDEKISKMRRDGEGNAFFFS